MHIGLISPGVPGHIYRMYALGQELMQRGHQITFFGVLDSEAIAHNGGLPFHPIGISEYPIGAFQAKVAGFGRASGIAAARYTIDLVQDLASMTLRDLPQALKSQQIDALIIDRVDPAAATIAQAYDIPFVTIGGLWLGYDPTVPPYFTSWSYGTTPWHQLRNMAGYALFHYLTHSASASINQYRHKMHLPPLRDVSTYASRLAIISHTPREFDFPRRSLPPCFHYSGPLCTSRPKNVPFPYERLTGQPLIYASMGTLHNRKPTILRHIVEACIGVDAQLVLSLGGGSQADEYTDLQKHALIVNYAPQLDLLARAQLTITHSGLNTVIESLSYGVPMVAVPVGNDQPGVAARLAHAGAGVVVPLSKVSATHLGAAIRRVLSSNSYRQRAVSLQNAIQRAGGTEYVVDIIEQAFGVAGKRSPDKSILPAGS